MLDFLLDTLLRQLIAYRAARKDTHITSTSEGLAIICTSDAAHHLAEHADRAMDVERVMANAPAEVRKRLASMTHQHRLMFVTPDNLRILYRLYGYNEDGSRQERTEVLFSDNGC